MRSDFKQLPEDGLTLGRLADMIPDRSLVYLDKFPILEIRKGLLVELANRSTLIGPEYTVGGDFFLHISTFLPMKTVGEHVVSFPPRIIATEYEIENVNYVFIPPGKDPNSFLKGNFERIASTVHIELWKRH